MRNSFSVLQVTSWPLPTGSIVAQRDQRTRMALPIASENADLIPEEQAVFGRRERIGLLKCGSSLLEPVTIRDLANESHFATARARFALSVIQLFIERPQADVEVTATTV